MRIEFHVLKDDGTELAKRALPSLDAQGFIFSPALEADGARLESVQVAPNGAMMPPKRPAPDLRKPGPVKEPPAVIKPAAS